MLSSRQAARTLVADVSNRDPPRYTRGKLSVGGLVRVVTGELRPVNRLAAPGLCEAKPDAVVKERRRVDEAKGRSHDGGGRATPRPAAVDAGEGVRRFGGGGHRVTFKTC